MKTPLVPFKDDRGRTLPGAVTIPGWARFTAQAAVSFSAASVLPEGEWFERLKRAPAPGQSCLVRVYPPFDLPATVAPVWTVYLPPAADLNGPIEAPEELVDICLVRLSVTEVLQHSPSQAWLVAQTREIIPLLSLPGRFAAAPADPPLGPRALSDRHIQRVRNGAITCVDINMEGDVGETLFCLEQEGRQHLLLHRVWSFTEVDIVYAGNRVLSDVEWAALSVGQPTDGNR